MKEVKLSNLIKQLQVVLDEYGDVDITSVNIDKNDSITIMQFYTSMNDGASCCNIRIN